MSKIVDERVVSMQFDNNHFENNVKTTLSTLDRLKQSLNLTGAGKGLENLNESANKVNISGISGAVETLHSKFSVLEVMGITALANITNSAVNAGKRIVSALTIDPIKTGLNEYETKINSVQTIMSNTASKGTTIGDVTKVLDELNTYSDKTIYNFAEMTRNIGTFTAAGVGLNESASAIKGIANLAAASGSSSQQASTAMYQLSQALATGTVKLMDWNSVVNAGMGGEKFQEALKATAREHGIAVDEIIKGQGSFRDSLQEGWLSADVLNETLNKFTVDGATNYAESMMESGKWTQEQADALIKEANAMEDAATKVKTFTQLWDTLKESAQSGWAQSWEIIIGNFDEAKVLFSEISDSIGGMLSKSSDARNEVLQGWKDLGGRTAVVDSFKNAFEGIASIVKPISEAFREIFPPTTSKQLYNFSVGLKTLTAKLKLSDQAASNLKKTFKGVFSVFSIIIDVISAVVQGAASLVGAVTGISGGVLGVTGAIGDFISKLRSSIKETDLFGNSVKIVTGFIIGVIDNIKELGQAMINTFKGSGDNGISEALTGFAEGFSNIDWSKALSIFNQGALASILLGVRNFVKRLTGSFKGSNGILKNITGILDDVRGCFKAYQDQLKAGTLLKIASAIAILATSLLVISSIDEDSLVKSLTAITVLFGELLGSLSIFSKMSTTLTGVTKSCALMINMSISIAILATALKQISTIDTDGLVKGLVGIGALMAEIAVFLNTAKFGSKVTSTAIGVVILSSAILMLAKVVNNLGDMDIANIGKGLLAIGAILTEIMIFTKVSGNSKNVISTATSMIILGVAMKIFASVLKDFGSMSWSEIGKGLTAMAGALLEIAIAMAIMPKSLILTGTGLVVVATAMNILANALASFGGMSWESIGKGLTIMGGALLELAIGLNLMNGTLGGSVALLVAAGALSIMAPVMKTLGDLSWESIAKGLIVLAGAFTVVGIAGLVLSPLIPSIIGLAAAFALLGIGTTGIGIGLLTISAGFTAMAAAGTAGAASAMAAINILIVGFLDLIPTIAEKLGEGLIVFSKTLAKSGSVIADSIGILISEVLISLVKYIPKIADAVFELLIGVLESVAKNLPRLITAAVKVIGAFFQGVVDALGTLSFETLVKGITGVGLLVALMTALSAVVGMIPGAMVGVLGMGVVIAELAVVIAAIGALAQIPGLSWLLEEGGSFLQILGTAMGQFVGGIAGGFMSGVSSSFPKIGSNLAEFMMNIQPFIDGAKAIDPSLINGMTALAKTILVLTAADVLNGMTSWLTGGNSMSDFAKQLSVFGEGLKVYSKSVSGIDSKAISNSAIAAKSLSELADNLPNSGGLIGWFAGENDISDFGNNLVPFGEGLKKYSNSISGIDNSAIANSATAAKALSELANGLPNSGGLISWFVGNNDISDFGDNLIPFGKGLKSYSDSIKGIDSNAVTNSATAAKSLSELANNLPNSGGLVSWFVGDNDMSTFGAQLVKLGACLKSYSTSIAGMDTNAVINSAIAAQSLSRLANDLPTLGGLVSWFAGQKDMGIFGSQLVPFGKGLKEYSISISGIDTNAVMNSATAAKSLSELAKELPNTGGFISWFTGQQDLGTFGAQLVPFGDSLKLYAGSIAGIDTNAVANSAVAGTALAELARIIPKDGGIFTIFTGVADVGAFGNQLVEFGNGITKYAASVANMESKGIPASVSVVESLAKLVTCLPSGGGLFTIFTGIKDVGYFGTQLESFGNGVTQYATAVANIDPKGVPVSVTVVESLAKLAEAIPTSGGFFTIFTGVKDVGAFGDQLGDFGEGVKKYAEKVKEIKPDGIAASVSIVESIAKLAEVIPKDGGLSSLFGGESSIAAFGSELPKFGVGLKDYSDAVKDIKAEQVSNSVTAVSSMATMIRSMDGLNPEGATSFKTAINALAQSNVGAFVEAFSGHSSELVSIGTNIANSIIQGIEAKKTALTSTMSTILSALLSTLDNKKSSFKKSGENVMTEIDSGLNKNKSKAKNVIVDLLNESVRAIREHYDSFYNAGSYLVSGFANGINDNIYRAAAKSKAMASAAAKAAKRELNEHSPSKVFYGIGDYAGKGFVNALADYANKAYSAGSQMALAAKSGLSKAISRISDVINSDIETQPTIRPVLDLSNISAGSRLIDRMFRMAPSVDLLSKVNAIDSTMSKGQNGVNDDLISEIKGLKKVLSQSSGDSYTINGITYDDGSNVSDAVKTIIKAARVERRK